MSSIKALCGADSIRVRIGRNDAWTVPADVRLRIN
jgi:hypothetical protein